MKAKKKFTIVGAGLSGPLMAVYLGRAGYKVDLHERERDPRKGRGELGSSRNLALAARGLHSLREIGIDKKVLEDAMPMRGRMVHSVMGDLSCENYGRSDEEVLYSVSRSRLYTALLDAAESCEDVNIFFRRKCVGVDLDKGVPLLEGDEGHSVRTSGDVLLGADGVDSAVREEMQKADNFHVRREVLPHGYKEISIPAGRGGGFLLDKEALHVWPRGEFIMIALPNPDGSFSGTLFWPLKGHNSFEALKTESEIVDFFGSRFPDLASLMPSMAEEFMRNPVGQMTTVRCVPWHLGSKAVLIGDAAHAVLPFYGQGMNAAFEDCSVLNACLQEQPDLALAFAKFEKERRPNTDALAGLALASFAQMRQHPLSRFTRMIKGVERGIALLLPGYMPLYAMVQFTRIPFAKAVSRSRSQATALALLGGALVLSLLGSLFSLL